jgi:hypothetical protein
VTPLKHMTGAVSDEVRAAAEATVDREAMERAFAKIKAAREQAAKRVGQPAARARISRIQRGGLMTDLHESSISQADGAGTAEAKLADEGQAEDTAGEGELHQIVREARERMKRSREARRKSRERPGSTSPSELAHNPVEGSIPTS